MGSAEKLEPTKLPSAFYNLPSFLRKMLVATVALSAILMGQNIATAGPTRAITCEGKLPNFLIYKATNSVIVASGLDRLSSAYEINGKN